MSDSDLVAAAGRFGFGADYDAGVDALGGSFPDPNDAADRAASSHRPGTGAGQPPPHGLGGGCRLVGDVAGAPDHRSADGGAAPVPLDPSTVAVLADLMREVVRTGTARVRRRRRPGHRRQDGDGRVRQRRPTRHPRLVHRLPGNVGVRRPGRGRAASVARWRRRSRPGSWPPPLPEGRPRPADPGPAATTGPPVAWILDLDGVIWLSEQPIAGSAEAIAALRDAGHRVIFLTNNAGPEVSELVTKLEGMGVPATPDEVVTSAQAAASLLEPGSTALLCAGPGVREALEARGVKVVRDGDADAVVVGFHRDFDYERLTAAFQAVHHGARLIGTNDDTTYPTPDGPIPGGGAILAAVVAAAGVEAEVAGKPYAPMAELLAERLRLVDERGSSGGDTILVGDRPSTDGLMARRLEVPFALVLSGVTAEEPRRRPARLRGGRPGHAGGRASWARLRSRRRPRGRW